MSNLKIFNNKPQLIKVLSIISFTLILICLSIIVNTPTITGYEISIYEIYPWYFWTFIISAIFIGQMILVISTIYKENSNLWIFGFIAILFTNTILLFMPFIRGYVTYGRGDVLTHIGFIKTITESSTVSSNNFYPIDHILSVTLYYITQITPLHIVNIIPPLFMLFYMISIYVLGTKITTNKKEVLLILVFSSILLFSNGSLIFAPNIQSFFLIPFVLYLLVESRNNKSSWKFVLLLILFLFLIVFFHPVTTLFLVLIFLIIELSIYIHNFLNKHNLKSSMIKQQSTLRVIGICLITFFTWYFSYAYIQRSFLRVTNWLIYGSDVSEYQAYSNIITTESIPISSLITFTADKYGQYILMASIGIIFSTKLLLKYRRDKSEYLTNNYYLFFALGFLIFLLLSMISFFGDTIIGFNRVFIYCFLFSSFVCGLGFYIMLNEKSNTNQYHFLKYRIDSCKIKTLKVTILLMCLLLLVYLSTFNLYFSPHIKMSNQQVSEMEIKGYNWFFDHRNDEIMIKEIETNQIRFSDLIYGAFENHKNLRLHAEDIIIPYHFGYANSTSLATDSYEQATYIIYPIQAKIVYQKHFPEFPDKWRLHPQDFHRFENDSSVIKVYDNKGFNAFQVI